MSEEIRELAPKFLEITYEITMTESSGLISVEEVAQKLQPHDLATISPEYEDLLIKVAVYLGNKGWLKKQSADWGMFSITKEGIAEVEGTNKPQAGAPSFHFHGAVQGSVVGTHNTAELTNTFNFGEFEEAIEERGSDDKAELLELREQVQTLLEEQDTVSRGVWAKFSELLKKHPWAVEFIGRAAAGWLTQQTGL
jgi:hypothetical protein